MLFQLLLMIVGFGALIFALSVLASIMVMFIFYKMTGGKLAFIKWYKKMFTFKYEREE